jgi:hypothetical protein
MIQWAAVEPTLPAPTMLTFLRMMDIPLFERESFGKLGNGEELGLDGLREWPSQQRFSRKAKLRG